MLKHENTNVCITSSMLSYCTVNHTKTTAICLSYLSIALKVDELSPCSWNEVDFVTVCTEVGLSVTEVPIPLTTIPDSPSKSKLCEYLNTKV